MMTEIAKLRKSKQKQASGLPGLLFHHPFLEVREDHCHP